MLELLKNNLYIPFIIGVNLCIFIVFGFFQSKSSDKYTHLKAIGNLIVVFALIVFVLFVTSFYFAEELKLITSIAYTYIVFIVYWSFIKNDKRNLSVELLYWFVGFIVVANTALVINYVFEYDQPINESPIKPTIYQHHMANLV